jgi:hypothetical protein
LRRAAIRPDGAAGAAGKTLIAPGGGCAEDRGGTGGGTAGCNGVGVRSVGVSTEGIAGTGRVATEGTAGAGREAIAGWVCGGTGCCSANGDISLLSSPELTGSEKQNKKRIEK